MRFLSCFLIAMCLTGCAAVVDQAPVEPSIHFSDNPALAGTPVVIRITDLEPNTLVTVVASRRSSWNSDRLQQSTSRWRSDESGTIDLSTDGPVEAEWKTADINGVFWAMRTVDGAPPEELQEDEVIFQVQDSTGDELLEDRLTVVASKQSLVETPLGDAFPGAFVLRPEGSESLPAIIILGGSEGGDRAARFSAPLWAARGYAAVGYPYYSPAWGDMPQAVPGLPRAFSEIPIDHLIDVRAALEARGDIQMDRIGLYGVSKGAEFVLAAASRIEGFAAVAAIVPSDVIWEGWGVGTEAGKNSSFSWQGEPLPFVPYQGMERAVGQVADDERVAMRVPHAEGRAANPDRVEPARIAVENIDEPVFLLGGGRDSVWDSGIMAANIAKTRADAGLETETLIFANATHGLSGPPQYPTRTASSQPKAASWPALQAFFERTLKTE